ncbi:MAG: hypothetical protein JWN07_1077 [Hyphomicrobiales bacterium]|nr:hypothetical protein [Hyphomicrobiales bacterium]
MNVRQLGILGLLTAVSLVAVGVTLRTGAQGFASDKRGQRVFPELVQRANDVASLSIRDAERNYTIEKRADGFYEKDSGYPAKADAFRDVVSGAALLSYEETKTADPARFADLGLADPGAAPDSIGRQVIFRDAKNEVMANVTAGNRDTTVGGAAGGSYIRLGDQKQTWLVRGEVRVPVPQAAWFEINFVNIGRDALAGLRISGGGLDEIIAVSENKGDDLKIANAPEGRETDGGKVMRLSFMVDPISFQDVRKPKGEPSPDARRMVVTSRNGYRVTYTSIGDVAEGWVRFAVDATDDAGKTEADELRKKVEGFEFKLAQHEIDMLKWGLMDVTAEPKPKS